MVKAIALLKIDYDDLGLFKLGFQKERKKDSMTFVGLFFANNIYLKQI
jgi:hypothetical protein